MIRADESSLVSKQKAQEYDPVESSTKPQRQVTEAIADDRRQRTHAGWHGKKERRGYQEKLYVPSYTGVGNSVQPKHTHLAPRERDRQYQKRTNNQTHEEVYKGEVIN